MAGDFESNLFSIQLIELREMAFDSFVAEDTERI